MVQVPDDYSETDRDIYDDPVDRLESDIILVWHSMLYPFLFTLAVHSLCLSFLAARLTDTDFHDKFITDKGSLLSILRWLGCIRPCYWHHLPGSFCSPDIRMPKFPGGNIKMGHACLLYMSFNAKEYG